MNTLILYPRPLFLGLEDLGLDLDLDLEVVLSNYSIL